MVLRILSSTLYRKWTKQNKTDKHLYLSQEANTHLYKKYNLYYEQEDYSLIQCGIFKTTHIYTHKNLGTTKSSLVLHCVMKKNP